MKLKIPWDGGALNDGLPYYSFMINNTILVETPPDIKISLQRGKIKTPVEHIIQQWMKKNVSDVSKVIRIIDKGFFNMEYERRLGDE